MMSLQTLKNRVKRLRSIPGANSHMCACLSPNGRVIKSGELVFHLASGETLSKFIARAEKSIKESMCCRIVITIQTAPWGDDNWSGIPEAATP
jgi:hypothetical protein